MFFYHYNSVEKQLLNFKNASIKLNFKNVSHCFRNSALTIIWNSLCLSNYNGMKRKLGLKKKQQQKEHLL